MSEVKRVYPTSRLIIIEGNYKGQICEFLEYQVVNVKVSKETGLFVRNIFKFDTKGIRIKSKSMSSPTQNIVQRWYYVNLPEKNLRIVIDPKSTRPINKEDYLIANKRMSSAEINSIIHQEQMISDRIIITNNPNIPIEDTYSPVEMSSTNSSSSKSTSSRSKASTSSIKTKSKSKFKFRDANGVIKIMPYDITFDKVQYNLEALNKFISDLRKEEIFLINSDKINLDEIVSDKFEFEKFIRDINDQTIVSNLNLSDFEELIYDSERINSDPITIEMNRIWGLFNSNGFKMSTSFINSHGIELNSILSNLENGYTLDEITSYIAAYIFLYYNSLFMQIPIENDINITVNTDIDKTDLIKYVLRNKNVNIPLIDQYVGILEILTNKKVIPSTQVVNVKRKRNSIDNTFYPQTKKQKNLGNFRYAYHVPNITTISSYPSDDIIQKIKNQMTVELKNTNKYLLKINSVNSIYDSQVMILKNHYTIVFINNVDIVNGQRSEKLISSITSQFKANLMSLDNNYPLYENYIRKKRNFNDYVMSLTDNLQNVLQNIRNALIQAKQLENFNYTSTNDILERKRIMSNVILAAENKAKNKILASSLPKDLQFNIINNFQDVVVKGKPLEIDKTKIKEIKTVIGNDYKNAIEKFKIGIIKSPIKNGNDTLKEHINSNVIFKGKLVKNMNEQEINEYKLEIDKAYNNALEKVKYQSLTPKIRAEIKSNIIDKYRKYPYSPELDYVLKSYGRIHRPINKKTVGIPNMKVIRSEYNKRRSSENKKVHRKSDQQIRSEIVNEYRSKFKVSPELNKYLNEFVPNNIEIEINKIRKFYNDSMTELMKTQKSQINAKIKEKNEKDILVRKILSKWYITLRDPPKENINELINDILSNNLTMYQRRNPYLQSIINKYTELYSRSLEDLRQKKS